MDNEDHDFEGWLGKQADRTDTVGHYAKKAWREALNHELVARKGSHEPKSEADRAALAEARAEFRRVHGLPPESEATSRSGTL